MTPTIADVLAAAARGAQDNAAALAAHQAAHEQHVALRRSQPPVTALPGQRPATS